MANKKILVIDDDPTLLKMLQLFLESHGFAVTVAVDGEEGIAKLKAEYPDLIILDVQMPRMDGYAFIFEMKKLGGAKKIPIIVLTAKEKTLAEIFKAEGVKEYITKPFKPEALLSNINKYV
jgi:DNA-binding response OmpR family regulator